MLRVWGCRVVVKNPQIKLAKLDDNTSKGIFLRYTATDKNIVYLDLATNQEKIASHVIFDEASFTTGSLTPRAEALKHSGVNEEQPLQSHKSKVKVKKLHDHATLSYRSTATSAGLDLFAPENFQIKGKCIRMIPIGIATSIPKGMYGRIAPRSGLTVKREIDVKAGVVDNDFRGELTVVLRNMGNETQDFRIGDKIAQLILEKYSDEQPIEWSLELDKTVRNNGAFGSTDAKVRQIKVRDQDNIVLSDNPYGPTPEVKCKLKGNDSTLGFELNNTSRTDKLTLIHCRKGTPAARIPRWRSQLRNAVLMEINGKMVKSIQDVIRTVEHLKLQMEWNKRKYKVVTLLFKTVEKISVHPQRSIPQMHYNQLNVVARHQLELKEKVQIVLE